MISVVLLIGLGPVSVKAEPVNSCPYLTDLGYCKEGSSSYYCGLKFNETGTLTIRFASDNVKIDQDGNAFFNYYDDGIIAGDYIANADKQFIINRTKDLVISATDITLYGGVNSIIANDANVGTRAKTADDIEINKNPGVRVAFYDASSGNLYVKGKRIVNGDAIPAGNSFFTSYDAGAEESKAHYCKKFGFKFTLQYGCFIGSTDKTAGEKEIANGCSQCDPNANLFDWSDTATGGTCTLPNSTTGTCASGTCVCDNNTDCDDGIYCNGSGACSGQTCSQSGNPCVAANQACNETTDACYGCLNDSACSGATPACEAANNICKQCTASNQTKCNDSLSCTLDSCGSNSCTNTLIAGNCLIGGVCYPNGATNPANDCQKCNTGQSTSAWSPKSAGTACGSSANSTCDAADTCNAGGTCLTNYAPATTIYTAATDCKNAVYCDGSGSYGSLTNKANGTVCTDDGNQCTTDTCSTGSCAHTNKTDGSGCNDSNECTQNDFCSISSPGTCTGVSLDCTAGDCTACNSGAGYCRAGSCTAKLTNGSICVDNTQCSAGNACATNLSTGVKKCEPATKCIIGGTDVVMNSGTKVCYTADSYTCNSGIWSSPTNCWLDCGLYPNQDSCSNSSGACTSVCATSCTNTNNCKTDAYCVASACRSGQGTLCVNNNDCDQGYTCTTNQADGKKYCLANSNAPKVTSFGVTPTTSSGAFTITYGGSTGDSIQLWRQQNGGDWLGLCDNGQWKSNGCTYLSIPASYADTPSQTGTYTYGLHIIKIVSGTTYVGTESTSGLAPITVRKVQCTADGQCGTNTACTTYTCSLSSYTCSTSYVANGTVSTCPVGQACDASGSCVSAGPIPDFCIESSWAYYDDINEQDVYNYYYYPQDSADNGVKYSCSGYDSVNSRYGSCVCKTGYTLANKGAYGSYNTCYDCDPYTCTDTTWSPDSATVCSGQSFTQTSNCGRTRTSPTSGACTPSCSGKTCGSSNGCTTGTCAATCAAGSGCIIQITTCAELQNMKNNLSANYEVANNIDCSATSGWNGGAGFEPIGNNAAPFTGKFDGKGYIISNLYISRGSTNYVGLFGKISGSTSEIKNIGLTNITITGRYYVGGLAGWNDYGIITNIYSSGSIIGKANQIGGLVGYNYGGAITNSYSTGAVSGTGTVDYGGLVGDSQYGSIANSYSTSAVSGQSYIGGLVGVSDHSTITDSYSTGNVSGTGVSPSVGGGLVGSNQYGSIVNSYSTGAVSATTYIGGFAGLNTNATITNSYWNTQTSDKSIACGGTGCTGATGKTTSEMTQQATYSGWVFPGTWKIVTSGDYYPCLSWQSNSTCKKVCPDGWQRIGDKCLLNKYSDTVNYSTAVSRCTTYGGWLPSVAELNALPCSEIKLRPGTGLYGYARISTSYSSGHRLYRDTGSYTGCNPYTWCGSDGYSSGTCKLVAIWLQDSRTDYGYVCLKNQQ